MKDLTIALENRPGALAEMGQALGRAGVSVEEYKEYENGTKIFTIEENLKAFKPGNDMTSLQFAAAEMTKFLVDVNLAKTKPDISKLFDDRFIKAYAEGKS